MKTYSVKEISDILNTNQETVRRWIRDGKLKATQESKKEGNVVTQAQLEAFLKASPKYLPKFAMGLASITPVVGVTLAIAGRLASEAILHSKEEKNKESLKVYSEDFKKYMYEEIARGESEINNKQQQIQKLQAEIAELSIKNEKFRYLLNNDDLIGESLKSASDEND